MHPLRDTDIDVQISASHSHRVNLQEQMAVAGTGEERPGIVHGGEWLSSCS